MMQVPVQPCAHQWDVIAPFFDTHFSLGLLPGSDGDARCSQRRGAIARTSLLFAATRNGLLLATRRVMKAAGTGRSGTRTQQQNQNDGDDDIEAGRTFGQTDRQAGRQTDRRTNRRRARRHERLGIESVRSFVRSVPCSHRALQSATDSAPLTPSQRASPLRSVTAPPLARKSESIACPHSGAVGGASRRTNQSPSGGRCRRAIWPLATGRGRRTRGRQYFSNVPIDVGTPFDSPTCTGGTTGERSDESRHATPLRRHETRTTAAEQGETSMFTRLHSCQPDGEGLK